MALSQNLLINAKTKEPYLRLSSLNSNIILTPPRVNDTEAIVRIMNDPRVFQWLEGPPYPYLHEHAEAWLEETLRGATYILKQHKGKPGAFVDGCPFRILREVKDNGEEIFLGDCGIRRWLFDDIEDPTERARMMKENNERLPGDPEIVWGFGDYLVPSHHGRGIMTAALGTIIAHWAIPHMGTTRIKASVWKGNAGSVKVFEKNGFKLDKTLENYRVIPESKGGGRIGLHVMRWQR